MNLPAIARATTLAGLAILLFACSTGFDTRPEDLGTLPEDYGVVVVQATNNIDELNYRLFTWTGAHVARIDQPDNHFLLKPAGTGLLGSRIFVGALPPGRYRIQNLISEWPETGNPQAWMEAPVTENLGTFRIEPGQLTSLGTVLFQPLGAVEENGRWRRVHTFVRYDDEERFDRFMSVATPDLYERLGERIHGWDLERNGNAREELAERVGEFAVGTEYHWLGGGEIAMTGPIGAVMLREGPGQWRRVETGVNHQLAAMAKTDDGYVVAGERGLVMRADNLDGDWQVVTGPGSQSAVEWMTQMSNGSFYALVRSGLTCTLFHVSEDFSEWTTKLLTSGRGGVFPLKCQLDVAAMNDDRIVLFGDGRRRILDAAGEIVLDEESDGFMSFEQQPNGAGIAIPDPGWAISSVDHVYTFDGGESWHESSKDWPTESDRVGEIGLLLVLPDHRALALSYKGYVDDFTKRVLYEDEPRLRMANEKGKIVRWGEKVEPYCRQLLPEISTEERIFARCSDGSLIVTEDRGESWSEDFAPGGDGEEALDPADFEDAI
ncbi:MAG: hypothetical protein GVY32_06785 [Gammaproteobacteria bacterium]|nr:hypothetical protein [Gammaproteobacteria bacterium]